MRLAGWGLLGCLLMLGHEWYEVVTPQGRRLRLMGKRRIVRVCVRCGLREVGPVVRK